MLSKIIGEDFFDSLKKGAQLILDNSYVRILAHYDGDGTSSAVILANALKRKGIKFHIGFIRALDEENFRKRIEEEKELFTIVVDAGSDQAKYIAEYENVVILDHHFYDGNSHKCLNINARDYGVDGTREASGATMAFLMALAIDEKNADLFPFFVSGAIADRQDLGGFKGLNLDLIKEYGKNAKFIHTLNFEGESLIDSITYSTDPFFVDLTGHPENVKNLLSTLKIEEKKHMFDLTDDEKRSLASSLAIKLLSQKVGAEAMKSLESEIMTFEDIGFTSKEISTIIDGNSKVGMNAIPVQYFLGDKNARNDMINNWRIFKTKLIEYVYRSYRDIFEEDYVQYFYAPESEMAGAISGILMLYVLNQNKPLVGFNVGNDNTKVSSRGTRKLVNRGLNLSTVMRDAALEVGGSGGGHDIAAGAVIPRGKEKQFIEIVNAKIKEQLYKTNLENT